MAFARVPSAGVRREAAFLLWLANLAFGTLLGANLLAHVPDVDSIEMWLFAVGALLSSVLTLTLVPGTLFLLLAHLVRRPGLLGGLQSAFWAVFQVLLFADTRVYNLFHYHLNGQVLNLVYTRGSEDSIQLGWQVWTAVILGLASVGFAETWLWKRALRRVERQRERGRPAFLLLRPSIVWCLVLLPIVFVEKSIYAQADLARNRQVTALARLFPLYARVPAEDLASRVLGVETARPPRVELEGVRLDYPRAWPALDPAGERPNVVVIVIDCLRQDLVDAEHTPRTAAWARDARWFANHVSGGNSTRYGIFSLIYSLHGSYWFPVLQEERSPVLVDTLVGAGYAMGIFGAASMNYPELRDTAWSAIRDSVHDDFAPPESWKRDELAAEAMIGWLGERAAAGAPFFGFLLLDSPHQTYSHPPPGLRFQPSAAEVDYLAMTANEGPPPAVLRAVQNRYLNAVWHADSVAGGVLAAIDRLGLAADTLVLVTGDHGEEFRECGFFGHTSAFTPQQVAVPFLLKGPDVQPGVETRPTSHLDFAPTLMERLGADPALRGEWCLGANLFAPPAARRRVISGWNELGVWTDEHILRVPLSPLEFDVEVYDYSWRLQADDVPILRAERETLELLGAECNRFLK
ncbi:MAG: sulfatase-like hydrolase/transferase [Planctomycetota bacterium]